MVDLPIRKTTEKTTENLKILPLWKLWKPLLVDDG